MRIRTQPLAALVALLTVFVGGLVWWQFERSHQLMRQQVLNQAEQRSLQLADAMAGQVGGLIAGIDLALQQLRREWDGDAVRFDATVRAILASLPPGAVTHVTVVGADGYIVYNSLNVRQRTYVGDREHFRAHLSGTDRLVIGKPVLSRLGKVWTFIVNRLILRNGRFAGTMNMSVSSEYMSAKLAGLRLSEKDIIGLLHADGTFMARSQDYLQAMGSAVPRDRPFLARGAPPQGIHRYTGALDQIPRIYAWRRLDGYGLITAIGLAEETVLAPLEAGRARDRLLSAGLAAMVAVFGGLIVVLLLNAARKQDEVAANAAFRKRVFESSRIPIVVMDAETYRYIDCNPAATEIYRHGSRAQTLGKTPLDVSAPVQYDGTPSAVKAGQYIEQALREGSVVFEWRHQRPDGGSWDAEVHLMSFQSGPRRLLQFTLQDITERKRAEEDLRRFKATLDQTRDCVFMFDPATLRFIYVNQGATDQVGYGAEELMRMTPVDIKPDFDEARFRELIAPLQAGGPTSVSFETRHRHRDGHDIAVEIFLQYVAPAGEPPRFVAFVRDITQRRQAEKALRRALFMVENTPQEVWLARSDGRLVYVNPAAAASVGYTQEELGRMTVADVDPVGGGRFQEHAALLKNGPLPPFETEHLTRDGRRIPKELRATYLCLDGEDYVCGFAQDITQRKQAEEALRRLNQELELRVEQRTSELAASNTQLKEALATLQRAQKELVRSEKLASLGALVAGVAHELSTPLGNSLTVATTLDERSKDFIKDVQAGNLRRSALDEFVDQTRKASALLTRNLFTASELITHFKQVAVDQTSAQRRPFDLAEAVGEMVLTLQPQFKKTPHRIETQIPEGIRMDSYPGPLGQVIGNLVSNALLHAFDPARAGMVRIEAQPADADYVRLTVQDNGRGIAPEHLGRVFDPFFTTRLGQGGSGLGLHIVYSIVTRVLGGRISVTSRPGEGALFTLELPRVAPDGAAGKVWQNAAVGLEEA